MFVPYLSRFPPYQAKGKKRGSPANSNGIALGNQTENGSVATANGVAPGVEAGRVGGRGSKDERRRSLAALESKVLQPALVCQERGDGADLFSLFIVAVAVLCFLVELEERSFLLSFFF